MLTIGKMNCENRKDEFSEHCEHLARRQVASLPSTLIRQIARAKNMIHFGQERLDQLRDRNPFQIDVSNESMKGLYLEIRAQTFLPEKPWPVIYVRLLLEYSWLGSLLIEERWTPIEINVFAAKRSALLKSIQQQEKDHQIIVSDRFSQRWTEMTPNFIENRVLAQNSWIDDVKEDLRAAVTTELHWMNTLHKNGHSK